MNFFDRLFSRRSVRIAWRRGLLSLGFVLAVSLMPAGVPAPGVSAQSLPPHQAGPQAQAVRSFDIPSQPLAIALKAYGEIVSFELFYDSTIVAGLRSASLRGTFSPQEALRRLLDGTGLVAISLVPGTVTIFPPLKPRDRQDLAEIGAKLSLFLPYLGQVQDGIRFALCQNTARGIDPAEFFVRLWIAPSGAVSSVAFISATGSSVSHPAYAAVLTRLVFEPPPSDMPLPVTMVLFPRASSQMAGCDHE